MSIDKDPFRLGVASGEPLAESVVLWTRLAPEPFVSDSGLPGEPVPLLWEAALDADFVDVVGTGEVSALPEEHHSVHVVAGGLAPATTYYYRFRTTGGTGETGEWTSPVGRTRTAPPADTDPAGASVRFGVVTCQAYHHGYFTPLKHLAAEEDVDAVVCVGDWLYEYGVTAQGSERKDPDLKLPAVFNKEAVTLEDYRLRYALYRTDPDLRAAHHAHPWIVTWDDHEVQNNYAGDVPADGTSSAKFRERRAAAYQAYYENMPLRPAQRPTGADLPLYRRLAFGRLVQLDVLDGRQYRDDQSEGDGWKVPTAETREPSRTLLGAEQESWLAAGWQASRAVWNVVAQGVVVCRRHNRLKGPYPVSMDAWDGYPAARDRFLAAFRTAHAEPESTTPGRPAEPAEHAAPAEPAAPAAPASAGNLVVLTGDVHVNYAMDIKEDFDDPASGNLGVELVTTSVSSNGNGADKPGDWDVFTQANPHLRFYNARRGYLMVTLGQERMRADFRTVSAVTTPGAPVRTAASFVSLNGEPGLIPA